MCLCHKNKSLRSSPRFVKRLLATTLAICSVGLFVHSILHAVRDRELLNELIAHGQMLQQIVSQDPRFSAVVIGGSTLLAIDIHGSVANEQDNLDLKRLVQDSHPPVIVYCRISVGERRELSGAPPIIWTLDPSEGL